MLSLYCGYYVFLRAYQIRIFTCFFSSDGTRIGAVSTPAVFIVVRLYFLPRFQSVILPSIFAVTPLRCVVSSLRLSASSLVSFHPTSLRYAVFATLQIMAGLLAFARSPPASYGRGGFTFSYVGFRFLNRLPLHGRATRTLTPAASISLRPCCMGWPLAWCDWPTAFKCFT